MTYNEHDRQTLGQRLEQLVQRQGLTQQELADELGIHRTTISKVFQGQVKKLTHYEGLAQRLGVELESLLPLANAPAPAARPTPTVSAKPAQRLHGATQDATVITVAIQKGGSGKTTTVVNLACLWAKLGRRVLIIDLDMQGHSALHLGLEGDGQLLMDAIRTRTKPAPLTTEWGVDILPGGSALRALTPHLLSSINPLVELRRLVRQYTSDYDLILVDTAPSLETTTCNAIVAADYLLIPVQTETGALDGLAALYEVYEMLAEDHGPLKILGCVPTLHDARTVLHDQMLQTLQAHEHLRPTQTVIKRSITVAEAFTMRQPLLAYAPKSDILQSFEQVLVELEDRLIADGALEGPIAHA